MGCYMSITTLNSEQSLYSQSVRRLTAKSWSREIRCYDELIALKFTKDLGSTAAEMPAIF